MDTKTVAESLLQIVAAFAGVLALVFVMKSDELLGWLSKPALRRYAKRTGRCVVVVSHARGRGFGPSMLTMADVLKVEKRLRKIEGRPVDLVLTTFGGELVAGLRLARVLKRSPNVRLVVPKYAFSAGTLVSVAAPAILAHPDAMFGPVDPQFGWFLDGVQSAKDWQHVVAVKGKDAKDTTVANAEVGRRIMAEMQGYLDQLMPAGVDRQEAFGVLLSGDVSHGRAISPAELQKLGFPVANSDAWLDVVDEAGRLVEKSSDGVHGYVISARAAGSSP